MKLHSLPRTVSRGNKRVGRGYGSGLGGHTSGRGQKGQKTRGKIPAHFIGNSWVWFKRLPFIRGKSLFSPIDDNFTLSLADLASYKSGEVVSVETLIKYGLLPAHTHKGVRVKLVNSGSLAKKLIVQIPASAAAAEAITKAGGQFRGQVA